MLSLLSPLWLLGLALLPVIRWLHRGGQHRRDVAVSRLALWRGAQASDATAGARRPPDPAWRRRALLMALLLLALAGPRLAEQRVGVTVWIDDSISMLTHEAQGTRLVDGLARVRAMLATLPRADVEARSLSDPWTRLGALDDATVAGIVRGAGRREPGAPPAALLQRDRQQWLVTDGADATLLSWPGGRRPDRVVRVGSVTRNVGLERLSARRHPGEADRLDLLLKVSNGGTATEAREVVFTSGSTELARMPVRIEAGAAQFVEVSIPTSSEVHATLMPGDALAEDDTIALDLASLRRHRIALDPTCPSALRSALSAHPALVAAPLDAADAQALVLCAGTKASKSLPTLRVVADLTPARPPGSLQWSPDIADSRRLAIDVDRLEVAARLQVRPGDTVVLAVGDEPVVVTRGGDSRLIETSLDFGAMSTTRSAETPLLVNLLVEQLFDRRVIDDIASVDRGPRSTFVAALPGFDVPDSAAGTVESRSFRDDARIVLWVAMLALLWEIAALVRQGWRLRAPPEASSS